MDIVEAPEVTFYATFKTTACPRKNHPLSIMVNGIVFEILGKYH